MKYLTLVALSAGLLAAGCESSQKTTIQQPVPAQSTVYTTTPAATTTYVTPAAPTTSTTRVSVN